MNYYIFLLIPVGLAGFVAFWCAVVKLVSLMGWRRLARYQVAALPVEPQFRPTRASVGGVSYKNVLKASVSAEGLGLSSAYLFRVGHPPLLVPWTAVSPVRMKKVLWANWFTVDIETDTTGTLTFSFDNEQLAQAMYPWVPGAPTQIG